MVPYNEEKHLMAVFQDDAVVYVKGRKKRTLWNLLLDNERERMYIETLDTVYEDNFYLIWKLLILFDADNILRIARCKMY